MTRKTQSHLGQNKLKEFFFFSFFLWHRCTCTHAHEDGAGVHFILPIGGHAGKGIPFLFSARLSPISLSLSVSVLRRHS